MKSVVCETRGEEKGPLDYLPLVIFHQGLRSSRCTSQQGEWQVSIPRPAL